ncbi:MAG: permease prefix domain 1-containing protein [Streptosporangiaceae bacterium]
MNEPVEDYLDGLLLTLPGTPREVRRTLAEVEAHLHDVVAEGIAAGLTRHEAEAAAVARVGPQHAITGRTTQFSRPAAALLRRTALAGALVGGVALVAYAISAGISWAMAAVRGGTFVIAPFPPGSYTQADCARWLAGDPSARTCVAAMTADHIGDILLQGVAAGFLGALALLAFWVLRSRWQDRGTVIALPVGSAEAVGAILALAVALGGAAVWLNLETAQRGQGAGQPLSIAIAAICAAAFFGIRLYRSVRDRTA